MVYRPLQGARGLQYWHILQTYTAAEVAFDRMARMLFRSELMRKKPNESDLCIFLRNDANVFYKSGDKPQNLRAETLGGAIIDECRQQKKEVWSQIVLPMLGRYNGWCDFLSTPNGFDWFHDLYDSARNLNPLGEWATFHAPSTECWWWTPDQVAQARANMSEAEFGQEILAEFRDIHRGKTYLGYGEHNLRLISPFAVDQAIVSPHLPMVVAMDFNVGHMRWLIGQRRNDEWYWFDEIAIDNTNTQECARELVERLRDHRGSCGGNYNQSVILVGDATGNSRHSSASQSDYVIVCQALDAAGIRWSNVTPDSNPPVKERVNAVNAKLKSASGQTQMWLHPTRCAKLKRDLERVSWKAGSQIILDQKTDSSLTHASDAAGYAVCALTPMRVSGAAGGLKVIYR